MEKGDSGFSFSQDIASSLSQLTSESNATSEIESQSQSSQNSIASVPHQQLHVPFSVPIEPKKARYNVPRWTKGLLKTTDDHLRLKNHEFTMAKQREEFREISSGLNEIQKNMKAQTELFNKMIIETTNFMEKKINENSKLSNDESTQIKSFMEDQISGLKSKNEEGYAEVIISLIDVKQGTKHQHERLKDNIDDIKYSLDTLTETVESLKGSLSSLRRKVELQTSVEKLDSPKLSHYPSRPFSHQLLATSTPSVPQATFCAVNMHHRKRRRTLVSEDQLIFED